MTTNSYRNILLVEEKKIKQANERCYMNLSEFVNALANNVMIFDLKQI